MDTEYRTVPFELVELKASDGGHEFTGYCSTFGNVDLGGDVMMRGAFDATLTRRARRRLLWQHDLSEPIGVEKSLKPDDRGLVGTWKIVDTARGSDAYKLLKAGAVDSMSIGYKPEDVEFDDTGVRLLKSVDLLECSVVSLPMNEQALVTHVKRAPSIVDAQLARDVPFEDVLAQIKGFLLLGTDEAEALQARRAADGRKLSDAHREALQSYLAEAKAQQERLERLLADQVEAEAQPAEGTHWKARIAFAQQLAARRATLLEIR